MRVIWSFVELEAEDVDVFAHPFGADGLRDGDHAPLDEPSQDDLADGLAVRRANLAESRVGEQVVLALGERTPGLDLDAALNHQLLVVASLVKGFVSI